MTILKFEDYDFGVATGTTVEEITQLAQAGFQKFDDISGIHVFRKPNKFNACWPIYIVNTRYSG